MTKNNFIGNNTELLLEKAKKTGKATDRIFKGACVTYRVAKNTSKKTTVVEQTCYATGTREGIFADKHMNFS